MTMHLFVPGDAAAAVGADQMAKVTTVQISARTRWLWNPSLY